MIISVREILITGADDALLSVRSQVLQSGAFVVSQALTVAGFKGAIGGNIPALVVICSSYSQAERATVRRSTELVFPGTPILTLLRASETSDSFTGETLPQAAGPAGLIAAAHRLIDRSTSNVAEMSDAYVADLRL